MRAPFFPSRAKTCLPLFLAVVSLCVASCRATTPIEAPGVPSILEPASPNAAEIADLFWLIFWVMLAIVVGVAVVLALAYARFRARSEDQQGRLIYGNTRLEIGWTAAPAVLLVAVFFLSLNVMCRVDADPGTVATAAGDPVRVQAIGHLWWWEFRLPELGVVTANELHLPVGRTAEFELLAEEVIHSFWVPQLHGKRDMIPGRTNYLSFTPTRTGVFSGACAEFCGIQHAWMRMVVFVEEEPAFQEWVRLQSEDALPPLGPLAEAGREVFFSNTCRSCHTIRGTGAESGAGPDLTHVASRTILAAGRLDNTPENMALWLAAPQEVKPGNHMPDPRLTPDQIAALVAYMENLR